MFRQLRNAFISGIIILLPLAATYVVAMFLINKVGDPASKLFFWYLDSEIRNKALLNVLLSIVSIVVVVIIVTALGFLSSYFLGKFVMNLTEKLIDRVPFINTVYKTAKQIVETFSKDKQAVFRKCVLLQFPRNGTYALGFLTSMAKGETQIKTSKEVYNVFVPTTPNPTSGFLIMVPKEDLISLDMTIGEGMKLIISGGAVVPPYSVDKNQTETIEINNPETK